MEELNVLIVEDVVLVALDMCELLEHAGYNMVGPAHNVVDAMCVIDEERVDIALIDVNLDGDRSDAVADRLAKDGIPFAFITGYSAAGVPERHRDRPIIHKPFRLLDLKTAINKMLDVRD